MSSGEYVSESSGSSQHSEATDRFEAGIERMNIPSAPEVGAGRGQETGSSSQATGANPAAITRGAWKGSDVKQPEIDWLYRSRRIPAEVVCRLPRDEVEPAPEPGEYVVFSAHFERGFGLPASDFFRQFLDFYELQPHHLPGNAVFYLSCYATFMEAYVGIRPTREAFARFFSLRINSVQGKDIPKPKPPVQCGSCIIGSRQGSPFFKFSGLESCRLWQETFFYVKNDGDPDLINLPAFNPAPPSKVNWSYSPGVTHIETNRVVRFMEKLMKETNICSDDIIRTFISRRVLPLKRRAHKMSEMYGPGDPTKITGLPLSKKDVVYKARQICQCHAGAKDRFPRIEADRRGPCRKRPLDRVDPDPYIHWSDLKMGRTHTSRPGNFSSEAPGSVDDLPMLEMPAQPAPNRRSMSMLLPWTPRPEMSLWRNSPPQGKNSKAPAPDAGTSQSLPSKRFRTEVLAGKETSKRRYKGKQMPVASGPALKLGPRPRGALREP
ncbi:hypothetical protein QYE76_000138 [Lolium multiflorum]|uniref:Transposase (putative) gypsy type domain-containing protein n=1 Tax=Lolium multiflorum TaxID=4521 RepID=A0AAD8RIK2_LOLMU|nr:hypothetical protein QYE76_000138 [Lolium multiflorum]